MKSDIKHNHLLSLKQNMLYLAIIAGLDVMCMAMKDIKRAQERGAK